MFLVARYVLVLKCVVYGVGKTWTKILASPFISGIILSKLCKQSNFNFFTYKMGKMIIPISQYC